MDNVATEGQCSEGLYWDEKQQSCDFPANVDTENCMEPGETTAVGPTTYDSTTTERISSTSPASPDCDSSGTYYLPNDMCDKVGFLKYLLYYTKCLQIF